MSDTAPTKLYTALLAAQRAFGPVIKNAQNPHLKNKYADLGAVLDTIEGPLWDNGLLVVQRFTHDQGGAILVTELIHAESGQALASAVPVVSKDPTDPQKIGATITYYRRYSLLALLGLAPEDDDGQSAAQPAPRQQQRRDPGDDLPEYVPPRATSAAERALAAAARVPTPPVAQSAPKAPPPPGPGCNADDLARSVHAAWEAFLGGATATTAKAPLRRLWLAGTQAQRDAIDAEVARLDAEEADRDRALGQPAPVAPAAVSQ